MLDAPIVIPGIECQIGGCNSQATWQCIGDQSIKHDIIRTTGCGKFMCDAHCIKYRVQDMGYFGFAKLNEDLYRDDYLLQYCCPECTEYVEASIKKTKCGSCYAAYMWLNFCLIFVTMFLMIANTK